jgi:hypothetical protein
MGLPELARILSWKRKRLAGPALGQAVRPMGDLGTTHGISSGSPGFAPARAEVGAQECWLLFPFSTEKAA